MNINSILLGAVTPLKLQQLPLMDGSNIILLCKHHIYNVKLLKQATIKLVISLYTKLLIEILVYKYDPIFFDGIQYNAKLPLNTLIFPRLIGQGVYISFFGSVSNELAHHSTGIIINKRWQGCS